jgi:hypothetical protein
VGTQDPVFTRFFAGARNPYSIVRKSSPVQGGSERSILCIGNTSTSTPMELTNSSVSPSSVVGAKARDLRARPGEAMQPHRAALVHRAMSLFDRNSICTKARADWSKLFLFVNEISRRYRANPYHTWHHAVDVADMAGWLVNGPVFGQVFSSVDKFWLIVAALVHDLDHPGHNNQWEVAIQSPLARKFNNVAVLEQHSLEVALKMMHTPALQFTETMPGEMCERGEELLGELVRATDFAVHEEFLTEFGNAVAGYPEKTGFHHAAFHLLTLKAIVKAADISNPARTFSQAHAWAERVMQEYWAQSRMAEALGIPMSPFNDETPLTLKHAQIGFIRNFALPLFRLLHRIEPETGTLVHAMENNVAQYETLI